MKRVFALVLFTLCLSILSAQAQFKATPSGISTITGDSFYVVDIKDKSAQELYSAVETYIMTTFRNPNAVENSTNSKLINIHAVFSKAFLGVKYFGNQYADVDMNLIIHFKDGRIRFDIPKINSMPMEKGPGGWEEVVFSDATLTATAMFNKRGQAKNTEVVESFNKFINGVVSDIVHAAKSNAYENW